MKNETCQRPVRPSLDLRDMLRQYCVRRSLECMERAGRRRRRAILTGSLAGYQRAVRKAVQGFYRNLPVGNNVEPPRATKVSAIEKRGYRLENLLFDSFPGWQVNATVYVPLDFKPPFPAVVVPVGHSGKQFDNYQLPAQFFARCGYLAITFDPPGQAGEKRPGNDHFIDGVRCYLVGETSSRYFVADALRCIDYLQTRPDVELTRGVAMTGVSGGGATTMLAGLLDDRVAAIVPSCCLVPRATLDIAQCVSGCPETNMWRRYAEGIDDIDILCGATPKPMLLMAGEKDEVFHIEDTRRLAEEVAAFYKAANAGDRFEFFVDAAGHCYSLSQARQFVRFINRWIRNDPDRPLPDLPDETFALNPHEELQCHPRVDVNIRSLTLERALELERLRDREPARILRGAALIAGIKKNPIVPKAKTGTSFQIWFHYWQEVLLITEKGIELPATFIYPAKNPAAAILHFDDAGRNRLLHRHGILAGAVRFLDANRPGLALLSADLRGWGDSAPAVYPYEMASWGGTDRCLAYMSSSLGDPVMSMRVRDGLAMLAYLRSRQEVRSDKICVSGCGLGGIVALHVAAIDAQVGGVVIWDSLVSFKVLLEADRYFWPADAFLPQVLLHYDLPDLTKALAGRIKILNPLDGTGKPLENKMILALNNDSGRQIYESKSEPEMVIAALQSMSGEKAC